MPYSIVYVKGSKKPWKIKNKATGAIVGSSTSEAKAKSSVRARMGSEYGGWKPTKKKRKKR